jgi:putative toxin-antitoxin system antitoxin component (TIGR02293 family)
VGREIAEALSLLDVDEPPSSAVKAAELVRSGLKFKGIYKLAGVTALTMEELQQALDIPARTFSRRKAEKRFSSEESERLLRLARIVAHAQEVLGDEQAVHGWLTTSNRSLGGRVPLSLLGSELGAEAVDDVLGRIDYGVVS